MRPSDLQDLQDLLDRLGQADLLDPLHLRDPEGRLLPSRQLARQDPSRPRGQSRRLHPRDQEGRLLLSRRLAQQDPPCP